MPTVRGIDTTSPPFDQLKAVRHLATARSGRDPDGHARHQLYAAQDRQSDRPLLVKVATKPGLVYEQNLSNEIASLTTLNRERPDSGYFPRVRDHGRLRDGRIYLITTLFDEFPLATTIGDERVHARLVGHLLVTAEVCRAVGELHALGIYHVDLNPMNILYRTDRGRPVIRIVDFESSYDVARHGAGLFYSPPITPGYSAPEVASRVPDARADIYSVGAVLYTMVAGYGWSWTSDAASAVAGDTKLDAELGMVLRTAVDPDPAKRYETIGAFGTAVAGYLESIWPGRPL